MKNTLLAIFLFFILNLIGADTFFKIGENQGDIDFHPAYRTCLFATDKFDYFHIMDVMDDSIKKFNSSGIFQSEIIMKNISYPDQIKIGINNSYLLSNYSSLVIISNPNLTTEKAYFLEIPESYGRIKKISLSDKIILFSDNNIRYFENNGNTILYKVKQTKTYIENDIRISSDIKIQSNNFKDIPQSQYDYVGIDQLGYTYWSKPRDIIKSCG